MKKYIGVLLAIGFLIAPGLSFAQLTDVDPNGNTQCAVIGQNLRYGMRDTANSKDVAVFQDFLSANGYLNVTPTGFFGILTLRAATAFQSANGISPTGFVGTYTRAKIKEIGCGNTPNPVPVPVPVPPTSIYLPGCTSYEGFSTTTGQSCKLPTATTYPAGCTSNVGYSPTTGVSCNRPNPTNCTSASAPSVTVLSPNGGETYTAGQQVTVRWTSCNIAPETLLQILLNGPFPGGESIDLTAIAGDVPNSGMATLLLPIQGSGNSGSGHLEWYQMQYGKYFKIRINQVQSPTGVFASDDSDNLFTINASTTNGCESGTNYSTTTGQPCNGTTMIPSITINATAQGQSSTDSITVVQGNTFSVSGTPQNLGAGFTRSFNFDRIFDNSCGNNSADDTTWTIKCTANTVGTGKMYVAINQNGKTYQSNEVSVTVIANTFPAGCLSNAGYSTTTGTRCDSTPTPYPPEMFTNTDSNNSNINWTTTGYNEWTGRVSTFTYDGTSPKDNKLNLWGGIFIFNSRGEVFSKDYGLVGHLKMSQGAGTLVTPPVGWANYIYAGNTFYVAFDATTFDDSSWSGDYHTDPLGTIKGGETYTVNFAIKTAPPIPAGCTPNNIPLMPGQSSCNTDSPSITVLSPNGGEIYTDGQKITLKWITQNIPLSSQAAASLQLYDVNNVPIGNIGLMTSDSLNDGQEIITLPTLAYMKQVNLPLFQNAVFGQHFKIVVGSGVNGATQDYSDNFFTINEGTQTSSKGVFTNVKVDKNTYKQGDTINVTWNAPLNSNAVPINATVDLLDQTGNIFYTELRQQGNVGFSPLAWVIPTTINPGVYKIRVGQSTYQDGWSDVFTINGNTVPPAPTGDSHSCDIDLVNNINTCSGAISVLSQANQQAVTKISLDPATAATSKIKFDITFSDSVAPNGWNINIGDSVSNDGYAGDGSNQSNDAEMQLVTNTSNNNYLFGVYGNDQTPPGDTTDNFRYLKNISNTSDFIGKTISFTIGDQYLGYDFSSVASGTVDSMQNSDLYALAGEPDTQGPVNYDIYAAFNRVIGGLSRIGTGVTKVHVSIQ